MSPPTRPRYSKTRCPACRPAAPVISASWWASTEWARPTPYAKTAPTWWSPIWPNCCSHDHPGSLPRRSVAGPRDPARPQPNRPVGVPVRVVQRTYRVARQPRRGRALRPSGHLPELVLRNPAAAVRRGRLRVSRGRPDHRRRHQRQDLSPAGRRRAVRRPLRPVGIPRTDPRPTGRDTDPPGALVLALGQTGKDRV